MPQSSGPGWRKEIELPPRLVLGTTYIASLRGRNDLITRVWAQSLDIAWEGVKHP